MKPFKFKEFTINQDKTAMKVGTDAVLLGSWCTVNNDIETILDIGAGTGILSLMLAQRSYAETIDAVEIDEHAYEQCVENFEQSDWGDRLFCYHCNFIDFVDEIEEEESKYDLIISNPPFYTDDFLSNNKSRNTARFTQALPFETLIIGVSKILSKNGTFGVIIPQKETKTFIKTAETNKLYANRICNIKGTETSEIKRTLIEFSFTEKEIYSEELTIEISRHNYTEQYKELTKNFYLKF